MGTTGEATDSNIAPPIHLRLLGEISLKLASNAKLLSVPIKRLLAVG